MVAAETLHRIQQQARERNVEFRAIGAALHGHLQVFASCGLETAMFGGGPHFCLGYHVAIVEGTLFNLLLGETPKRVLMVCSESYTAENERMIAALMGHEIDVAYSVADIEMPPDRRKPNSRDCPIC